MDHALRTLVRLSEELEERSVARLPPERDLAERLGTSRTTVRKALETLERDGVIRRVRGRSGGAYLTAVSESAPSPEDLGPALTTRRLLRSLNTVKGVPQMLHEQGFHDATKVISAQLARPSRQAAESLGVGPDEEVVSLRRLRYADGDTLSLEQMYLNATTCAGILGTHLDSVYEALGSLLGVRVCIADESIELGLATDAVASLLGQPGGTPVLRLERIGYDENERPIEYSVDVFRADRTRLRVRSTIPPEPFAGAS